MIFPPVAFSPYETLSPSELDVPKQVEIKVGKVLNIASINIHQDGKITRARNAEFFFGKGDKKLKGKNLNEYWLADAAFWSGISNRFENIDSPMIKIFAQNQDGTTAEFTLSTFAKRSNPIKYSKVTIREKNEDSSNFTMLFNTNGICVTSWYGIPKESQMAISSRIKNLQEDVTSKYSFEMDGSLYNAVLQHKSINWPYAPCKGHIMGIDAAGRDVFARVLYALRTSLMFGLTLVCISMILGILAGSIQGYYGGTVDISFQRFTEIWSALPFLYIMILLGSILGRGFGLFLLCYGLFNWIGISYYIRAEYLRLRQTAFVDSAKCLGLPSRIIIFKHILPNALTPIITFFPFSLVGAISSLAALDYLGFGLPPPTPSWGELLQQAQQYRWAWWLILYPSLALFTVILLSVFIGEGLRDAFDPKSFSKIK
jgi:microcin C transport system permease protein